MFKSLGQDIREILAELRDYRELLWLMTRRDIVIRYRKAALGFAWAIFTPVMNMVVFTIVFNRVARIETDVPYPIFAYAGLLPWNLFSSSLKSAIGSLVTNKGLVTKVYLPRELFPLSGILVALVDFFVGASVLAVLMVYYQIAPTTTALFLPVILIVQLMFTAGLGLLLAVANLYFRDVKYIFDVVIGALDVRHAGRLSGQGHRRGGGRAHPGQPDDADHRRIPCGAACAASCRTWCPSRWPRACRSCCAPAAGSCSTAPKYTFAENI